MLETGLSVIADTSALGKVAQAAAEVNLGDCQVASWRKHMIKYLIMRETAFGISDDHSVTVPNNFPTPSSPLPLSRKRQQAFNSPKEPNATRDATNLLGYLS